MPLNLYFSEETIFWKPFERPPRVVSVFRTLLLFKLCVANKQCTEWRKWQLNTKITTTFGQNYCFSTYLNIHIPVYETLRWANKDIYLYQFNMPKPG